MRPKEMSMICAMLLACTGQEGSTGGNVSDGIVAEGPSDVTWVFQDNLEVVAERDAVATDNAVLDVIETSPDEAATADPPAEADEIFAEVLDVATDLSEVQPSEETFAEGVTEAISDEGQEAPCEEPSCTIGAGLVLYLPLDHVEAGPYQDLSGNGHDATANGHVQAATGVAGGAVSFSDGTGFLAVAQPLTLKQGRARTISLFFKAPVESRRRVLFHQADGRDLNDDGWPDLVFSNQGVLANYDLDSYVYWGSKSGYSNTNRSLLPTHGAYGNASGDLNNDGWLDIVFANCRTSAGWDSPNSYVYLGSGAGFSSSNVLELPTHCGYPVSIGDVNLDSYLDIVFSNFFDGKTVEQPLYLYLGSETGPSPDTRVELPATGSSGNFIRDVDLDGWPDIAMSNQRSAAWAHNIDSFVYLGSAAGFSAEHRLGLPTVGGYGTAVADLNGDGYNDIVFSNHTNGKNYELASYVYWGGADGFDPNRRTELPTKGAIDNAVADLNNDGWLDIVFSCMWDDTLEANIESLVYFGSPSGFDPQNPLKLPTHGATGNAVADLNRDGYPDVVFSNHMYKLNDPTPVPSVIYWSGPQGLDPKNKTELETTGAVGVSVPGSPICGGAAFGSQPCRYGSTMLYVDNGQLVFEVYDRDHKVTRLSALYSPDGWTHVVAGYDADAGRVFLYVDGTLAAEAKATISVGTWPWQVRIGSDAENQDRIVGAIDEVRVYERVLSDEEIAFLHAGL